MRNNLLVKEIYKMINLDWFSLIMYFVSVGVCIGVAAFTIYKSCNDVKYKERQEWIRTTYGDI